MKQCPCGKYASKPGEHEGSCAWRKSLDIWKQMKDASRLKSSIPARGQIGVKPSSSDIPLTYDSLQKIKNGGTFMTVWEDFEIKCTEYLNTTFGEYAEFVHQGGPNSTVPDIKVTTKSGRNFYIGAKHSPAQCGQFVLLPDVASGEFIYSK